MALPSYAPMMATLGQLPADDPRFAYEMKWDGVRALGYVDAGRLRLVSRNARDVTVAYPELAGLAGAVGRSCVLDGEIVAMDGGRPSFRRLQDRMHQRNPDRIRRLTRTVPVTYLLFDVLHLDGSLVGRDYEERRAALEGLGLAGPRWDTPPAFVGGGAEAVAQSRLMGLEGVVAKRLDSVYRPGKRVAFWIKVKNLITQEVLVCGWKPSQHNRAGSIRSLVLGVPEGDGVRYIGNVGTGFTERMLVDLRERLTPLERDRHPFLQAPPRAETRNARWVEPRLVGEVAYGEQTGEGHLRHPSWRGLRPDKEPGQVRWEQPG